MPESQQDDHKSTATVAHKDRPFLIILCFSDPPTLFFQFRNEIKILFLPTKKKHNSGTNGGTEITSHFF